MSTQFYSVQPNVVQNVMGGTQLHTPQSILQPTMNRQTTFPNQQAQWMPWNVPEVPQMSMPWVMPSSQQPDLVIFSDLPASSRKTAVHDCYLRKRKWEMTTPDVVDFRPRKQFMTEEKMTKHFQNMHISTQAFNAQQTGPSTSTSSFSDVTPLNSVDIDVSTTIEVDENNVQPRLVISEELKKLQPDPILPSSLLSKLERPSMALVLWEPPSNHLRLLPTPRDTPTPSPIPSSDINNSNGYNSNENNNNESIPDLNQTMDVNTNDPALEPMDL